MVSTCNNDLILDNMNVRLFDEIRTSHVCPVSLQGNAIECNGVSCDDDVEKHASPLTRATMIVIVEPLVRIDLPMRTLHDALASISSPTEPRGPLE